MHRTSALRDDGLFHVDQKERKSVCSLRFAYMSFVYMCVSASWSHCIVLLPLPIPCIVTPPAPLTFLVSLPFLPSLLVQDHLLLLILYLICFADHASDSLAFFASRVPCCRPPTFAFITYKSFRCFLSTLSSGKTTLLSVLLGRTNPDWSTAGTVLINGEPSQLQSFRKMIGYVPQDDIMHRYKKQHALREYCIYLLLLFFLYCQLAMLCLLCIPL